MIKQNEVVIRNCKIEQVGFVPTMSDGEPIVCYWGFKLGGRDYTVGQLKDISDKYWADKEIPRLKLNEAVDFAERRITKQL